MANPDNTDALTKLFWSAAARLESLPAPNYPIYIPTRGRAASATTPRRLTDAGLPFVLAVEPQEAASYAAEFPNADLLVLPESNRGIAYARNAIKEDAKRRGAKYHWQIDDDVRQAYLQRDSKEIKISIDRAIALVEFLANSTSGISAICPRHIAFSRTQRHDISYNRTVYTFQLLETDTPFTFRHGTVEDVDYSLQLCDAGLSTVLINRLLFKVPTTGSEFGGNTEIEYSQASRKARANGTQACWPGVFSLKETRFGVMLAPSRIWRTFEQRPQIKEGVVVDVSND